MTGKPSVASLSAGSIVEFQASIGSKKYPESSISSIAEYWFKLQEGIGSHTSTLHTNAISLADYTGDSFVIGISLEKVLSDHPDGNFSGISTKQGDLMSFRCKNISTSIDTAVLTIQFDSILQISEEGCTLFD